LNQLLLREKEREIGREGERESDFFVEIKLMSFNEIEDLSL
jgi:hypothetical protein